MTLEPFLADWFSSTQVFVGCEATPFFNDGHGMKTAQSAP
jgi:hypothetical protein